MAVTIYLVALCLLSVGCLLISRETVHHKIDLGLENDLSPALR